MKAKRKIDPALLIGLGIPVVMIAIIATAIFIPGYLSGIEYFKDSLGWPLALVISGMMLMGVGFLTFRLKRRYLNE